MMGFDCQMTVFDGQMIGFDNQMAVDNDNDNNMCNTIYMTIVRL